MMFEAGTNIQEQRGLAAKYYGKYPGLVLDNGPPEEGEHRGELLVEVPGILEETPDGSDQRPIQVTAIPCFHPGFFFIPEPGAQVWIEFVAGDINCPLWTGVWYPTDATPQTEDDEAPTEFQKVIRTASGHVVQLDDTENEEKIVVKHKLGSSITIDHEGHITIVHKDGMTIELTADNTIAVTSDAVTITADVTIDGTLQVTGDTGIDGKLTVGTGPTTTIEGNEITGG